jgi:hypothetical protein
MSSIAKIRALSKGGASSWNDLKDKPFYEKTITVSGDTLTWDGNTEGHITVFNEYFVKVSDAMPTESDFANGFSLVIDGGETIDVSKEMVSEVVTMLTPNLLSFLGAVVAYADGASYDSGYGFVFPEAGIYFPNGDDGTMFSLTIPGYTGFTTTTTELKTLETKYLPEHLQFGETTVNGDTLTWDGNTEGLPAVMITDEVGVYMVSDRVITPADAPNGLTLTFNIDGEITTDEYTNEQLVEIEMGVDYVVFATHDNFEAYGVVLPKPGVWCIYPTTITIPGYPGFETTTVKPIDSKYLPEHLHFGDTTTVKGDTLTWDGNTEGLVCFDGMVPYLYKVSDVVLTMDDLASGATVKISDVADSEECTVENLKVREIMPGIISINSKIFIFAESIAGTEVQGMKLPEAGMYFYKYNGVGQYIESLTIPGYTGFTTTAIKTIDPKYLPTEYINNLINTAITGAMEASY